MTHIEAFERDIDQEDVLIEIGECLHNDRNSGRVTINQREMIDAINVRGTGILRYKNKEYDFIASNGDNAGFVLEDWNTGKTFYEINRQEYALAPIIHYPTKLQAVKALAIWKNLPTSAAKIPRKYMYDRYFQPGFKVESHWKKEAEKFHMKIVPKEEANEILALYERIAIGIPENPEHAK